MRPIKFRYRFQNRKTGEMIIQNIVIESVENRAFTPNPFGELNWEILSREQFTGLLDRNGNEIYEGDILKVRIGFELFEGQPKRNWNYCDYIGPIEFEPGCFRFKGKNKYGHGYSNFLCCQYNIEDCEVIGNIHEITQSIKSIHLKTGLKKNKWDK